MNYGTVVLIICSLKKKIGEPAGTNISTIITH